MVFKSPTQSAYEVRITTKTQLVQLLGLKIMGVLIPGLEGLLILYTA